MVLRAGLLLSFYGLLAGWCLAEEDAAAPPPSTGPSRLFAASGVSFERTRPVASPTERPSLFAVGQEFNLLGRAHVRTTLFVSSPPQAQPGSAADRWQRRLLGLPVREENAQPLDRSAFQLWTGKEGEQGSWQAEYVVVGQDFEPASEHQWEQGMRRWSLGGKYQAADRLELRGEYRRQTREDRTGRVAESREERLAEMELQPWARSTVKLTHERQGTPTGLAPEPFAEKTQLRLEQELDGKTKLALEQTQEHQLTDKGEKRERESEVKLTTSPTEALRMEVEHQRQQKDGRAPETRQGLAIDYEPAGPLKLELGYEAKAKGDKQSDKREVDLEAQATSDLKLTTGYEQQRKRGDRLDTHEFGLEATPGPTTFSAGYKTEEKSGGERERRHTLGLTAQPLRALSVGGDYSRKETRAGELEETQGLRLASRWGEGLTWTAEQQVQARAGETLATTRKVGAETHLGSSLSISASHENQTQGTADQATVILTTGAEVRFAEALSVSGQHKTRAQPGQDDLTTRIASVSLSPTHRFRVTGRYAENPEDDKGRVQLGTQSSASVELRPWRGWQLNGTYTLQANAAGAYQQTGLGLQIGSARRRLYSGVRLDQTRGFSPYLGSEYRLGFSGRLGSLNLSLEGVMERKLREYGLVDDLNTEYRGEAKLELSF